MAIKFSGKLRVNATTVSNEFIDNYMAAANGEYVKVYLYLLRHEAEDTDIGMIADALNHTEADVKRALLYWRKAGVLEEEPLPVEKPEKMVNRGVEESALSAVPGTGVSTAAPIPVGTVRAPYPMEKVNRLTKDEDFTQLLYIAQKYMNKVFTQRECEVFAYLYDGLRMDCELLEYLVEYCVQNGHTSIRYIETVGINWHEKGLHTVEEAKAYSAAFTRDSFAVMKAFGLSDRKPGTSEKEMIEKWVKSYGFTKEVIVEACNRTMDAIHTPSFKYADKILSEWVKAGVKSPSDIRVLDQKRRDQSGGKPPVAKKAASSNQFHNFNQRDTDYDAIILQNIKEQ